MSSALPSGPGKKHTVGTDLRDNQARYLIKFSDGGGGMRYRHEPLEVGAVTDDGGQCYIIETVEPPPNPSGSDVHRLDWTRPKERLAGNERGGQADFLWYSECRRRGRTA